MVCINLVVVEHWLGHMGTPNCIDNDTQTCIGTSMRVQLLARILHLVATLNMIFNVTYYSKLHVPIFFELFM